MAASLSPSISKTGIVLATAFGWLVGPTLTAADVYIWTDERGTTVISDTPPANPKRITNLETVVKDPPRKTAKSTGPHEPTPTERKLLERIDQLERQNRGQTYAAPAPPPPAPAAYSGNYYTSPPAPAYSSPYSSGYYDPYDPYYSTYPSYSYYPNSYPSYYPYGAVIASPIIVRRGFVGARNHVTHHGFVNRGVAVRGGAAGRGRR